MIVHLEQLWLNPLDDLEHPLVLEFSDLTHSPVANVRVDVYAGGNKRLTRMPGDISGATVTMTALTDDQVAWLKDHIGAIICWRDARGLKLWGVYTADSFHPIPLPNYWSVSLTLMDVTIDETTL